MATVTPNEINYSRQTDMFNPDNQRLRVILLGAGSLGSFIALNLAKLGFSNIHVWDYDRVEAHNIPNQFYRMQDIDKFKVDALKEIVKEFADVDISIHNEKVTSKTEFDFAINDIFILTFDTLEGRKMFFDLCKDFKAMVLDVRVGGEEYNIQVTDTFNEIDYEKWRKSFNITPTKLPCGAKSIIYTNLSVASEVCNIIKKINNDECYPTKIVRHMNCYLIINNYDGKVKDGS